MTIIGNLKIPSLYAARNYQPFKTAIDVNHDASSLHKNVERLIDSRNKFLKELISNNLELIEAGQSINSDYEFSISVAYDYSLYVGKSSMDASIEPLLSILSPSFEIHVKVTISPNDKKIVPQAYQHLVEEEYVYKGAEHFPYIYGVVKSGASTENSDLQLELPDDNIAKIINDVIYCLHDRYDNRLQLEHYMIQGRLLHNSENVPPPTPFIGTLDLISLEAVRNYHYRNWHELNDMSFETPLEQSVLNLSSAIARIHNANLENGVKHYSYQFAIRVPYDYRHFIGKTAHDYTYQQIDNADEYIEELRFTVHVKIYSDLSIDEYLVADNQNVYTNSISIWGDLSPDGYYLSSAILLDCLIYVFSDYYRPDVEYVYNALQQIDQDALSYYGLPSPLTGESKEAIYSIPNNYEGGLNKLRLIYKEGIK